MSRSLLTRVAVPVLAFVTVVVVYFVFFRHYGPELQDAASLERQAAELAAHREQQRLRSAPSTPPVPPPASAREPDANAANATVASPGTDSRAPGEAAAHPYWTDFRGPLRDGHYRERAILSRWPAAGLTPLWKQPVGGGHASFVVAEGRAFTVEQRGSREAVVAYDVTSGRELWSNAWPALFNEAYGGAGPRATPTWHRGTVFAVGADGEFRALDATSGAMRWRTNILHDAGASNLEWGMSASPLVIGDLVVVVPGGDRAVAAYDRRTGKRAWTALEDGAGYSSPMVASVAGVEQIVVFAASRVAGLSPDGGRVLWEYPWTTQSGINVAQPLVIGNDRVFISSGYGMGGAVIEIARHGDDFTVREVWRNSRMKNQFTSSVHHEGFIYGLDQTILACLDAATGEVKWKDGRYGHGQVVLASGHLIVLTEDGELALVRATPERHQEVARFRALDGRTWNHPALAGGYLLVRNAREMAAFDLR